MENIKETLLKSETGSVVTLPNGITYYKLYPGFRKDDYQDYTKNCGLLGTDIDNNFYFLRGYDIYSVEYNKDNDILTITRVDGEEITVDMKKVIEKEGHPKFEYDKETGTITITYTDGFVDTVDGFMIDTKLASDATLKGNGSKYNPIGLSPIERTGTYAPAQKLVDITETMEMPEGKGKGYRIVTKEKIDYFGRLYPYAAVEMIDEALKEKGSEWHIPTKEEWDDLLNSLECAEDRNHSGMTIDKYYGRIAGSGIKSANLWKEYTPKNGEISTAGEDIYGLSVYPLGNVPPRNAIMDDVDHDAEGFSKLSEFWTSTLDEVGTPYVKVFAYNNAGVRSEKLGKDAKLSIRLVKDYDYTNYNEYENILGLNYPTTLVYGKRDDYKYVKIWTSVNVFDSDSMLSGVTSDEWSEASDTESGRRIVYFINEWDGTKWYKKAMSEGDSVVIINGEDKDGNEIYNHEWRVYKDGKEDILKDTYQVIMDDTTKIVKELSASTVEIEKNLNELSSTTVDVKEKLISEIARVDGRIDDEIDKRASEVTRLDERIDNEESKRAEEVTRLDERIDTEETRRAEEDGKLHTRIDNEENKRAEEVSRLDERIDNEQTKRAEEDKNLHLRIDAEEIQRAEEVSRLDERIDNEETKRAEEDTKLNARIENEEITRAKEDARLGSRIDTEEAKRAEEDEKLGTRIDDETKERIEEDARLDALISVEAIKRQEEEAKRAEEDKKLHDKIDNEIADRIANDIVPGDYTLGSNDTMTIPTKGENVDDVNISISDNFFDFGKFE